MLGVAERTFICHHCGHSVPKGTSHHCPKGMEVISQNLPKLVDDKFIGKCKGVGMEKKYIVVFKQGSDKSPLNYLVDEQGKKILEKFYTKLSQTPGVVATGISLEFIELEED